MSIQSFSPYLPGIVLGDDRQPDEMHGAVMFTDIVDFTRLTDRYAERGAEGAEQLAQALDAYFDGMSRVVLRHDGDIVDFIGDALVVLWQCQDSDAKSLLRASLAAARCGLEMQRELQRIGERIGAALAQRISISAGALSVLVLGDEEQKHVLLAGPAVEEASRANHRAEEGKVLCSGQIATAMASRCQGYTPIEGCFVVDTVTASPGCLSASTAPRAAAGDAGFAKFLPESLRLHQASAAAERLAEFRNVSTLFIRFGGLDSAASDFPEALNRGVKKLQSGLRKYGGSLERLSCDEKGITALSALGLPYKSREHDALHALRAGLNLESQLADIGITSSIGITRGRIFYVDTGGAERRHVSMVGDSVNLAARLMTARAQGLLCDQASYDAGRGLFRFEPAGFFSLKGKEAKIQAYVPRQIVESSTRSFGGAIADRIEETKCLLAKIDRLQQGHGGLAILSGEAGVGKSRLLSALIEHIRDTEVRCVHCAGVAAEAGNPYFPWQRLLSELLIDGQHGGPDLLATTVEDHLQGFQRLQAWRPLLNDVLPLEIAETELTQQMSGAARASALQALLLHLTRAALGDRPTVIVLDDLHWFDEASADLLDRLITEGTESRVLILLASRPVEEPEARTARLLRANRADTLALDVIPREYVSHFIAIKLGVETVPAELERFVIERTSGHALYAEELLNALRSAALLVVKEGQCRLSKTFSTETLTSLPDTLEGIIVGNLDRLSVRVQGLIKTASVLGRDFSLRLLEQVSHDKTEVMALATAAVAGGFLVQLAYEPEPVFSFRHAIIRDVVYGLLPFAQRRASHSKVADYLQRAFAEQLPTHAAELAYHWEQAGESARAIEQYAIAAAVALHSYANREVIEHIHRAYAVAEREQAEIGRRRESEWQKMLGDAYTELFETKTSIHHYVRALDGTPWPVPKGKLGMVVGVLWQVIIQFARRGGLQLRRKDRQAEQRRSLEFAAEISLHLSPARFFNLEMLGWAYHFVAGLNLAERAQSPSAMAWAFASAAAVLSSMNPRWGGFYARRALAIAEQSNSFEAIGGAYLNCELYAINRGEWSRMSEYATKGAEAFEAAGAVLRAVQCKSAVHTTASMRGHFDEALRVLRECRDAAPAGGISPFQRSWPDASELTVRLARGGEIEDLVAALEAACADERMPDMDKLRCLGLIALARWRAGKCDAALLAAEAAWKLARDEGAQVGFWIGDGVAAMVEVLVLERTRHPQARSAEFIVRRARQACQVLRNYAATAPMHKSRAWTLEGLYWQLDGNHRKARSWFDRAIDHAQGMELPLDLARALAARASLAGQAADQDAAAAELLLQQLGAHTYLK